MSNVNQLEFNQAAAIINELQEQVTGKKSIAPVNTSEFISVATSLAQAGYDPILASLTQMITRTIFSIRPYSRRFSGLQVTNQQYGAITRKIQLADKPFEDDQRFELVDGQAIDHYKVNKPNALQTNFYGANTYQKSYTIFRDQLDNAFTGPDQFSEFITMITTNASDMVEQAHEDTARATIANFIGGKVAADNGVIHLLTEYNELTGLSLDAQSVYQPENFKPFMEWVYSRIEALSQKMTERSSLFQIEIDDKPINRHTPQRDQRIYLYAPAKAQIEARVLANTYHDNYIKYADTEAVNFWQNILDPEKINVTPSYINNKGEIITGSETTVDKVFGIMFDRDTMGYTVVNQWSGTTPLNVSGGYWNTFLHFTEKYWVDYTEKGIILLLD